jgi:hypothetical protein
LLTNQIHVINPKLLSIQRPIPMHILILVPF